MIGIGIGFISVVAFICLVVLSHEFGHYLVARAFGVKVLSFSVGFGPVLWKKLIGETEWRVCAVLIGGQVRMLGEGPSDVVPDGEGGRSFVGLSSWKKSFVVVAGAAGNVLLAVFIFIGLYLSGVRVVAPEIGVVEAGSPAEAAGLLHGDVVVSVDGVGMRSWPKLASFVERKAGVSVLMTVKRGDSNFGITVVPKKKTVVDVLRRTVEVGYLGVSPSGRTVVVHEGLGDAVVSGFRECWNIVSNVAVAMARIITGYIPVSVMAGPIVIAKTVSDQASRGLQFFLHTLAFISINIGVFNLLPLLPFDGGFLAIFAYEGVSGKPVSERFLMIAQRVGVLFVVLLLVLVFYNDIAALFFRGGK